MRRYRARMSDDKKDEMKKKNTVCQAKCRKGWSSERKKKERINNTIIQRNLRVTKAKDKYITPVPIHVAFKSVQSAGKAVRRVAGNLPKSPRKACAVIQKLASDNCISLVQEPKAKKSLFPEDILVAVQEFYEQDYVSYQMPGKKDYKIVVKDGKKHQVKKKLC